MAEVALLEKEKEQAVKGAFKRSQSRGTIVTSDSNNSIHTYSEEEKEGLVDYINALLRRQQRPINPKSNDIFEFIKDGILLCRIVNAIQPGAIDESRVNNKDTLSIFEKGENLMLALQTAQEAFNISFVNIGVQDVLEGRPVLVLSLLWQLVTVDLRTRVRFHSRDIAYLLSDEEDASGADVDESEGLLEEYKIILRWVNHHLSLAGVDRRVRNFSNDFKDSVAFVVLLNRLAPQVCTLEALKEPMLSVRAALLLKSAELIGCKKFLSINDILQGNSRLIFAFLAYLFTKFNKPVEIRKVEERIEEQAIELADIHKEIEYVAENISQAEDKIKDSSQKVAVEKNELIKEKEILQKRITKLEDQRKAQNDVYSAKIDNLKKAVEIAKAQQLPTVAELTAAIAAVTTEQEEIHKAREAARAEIEVLKDDVTAKSASRHREESLLTKVNSEIKTMEVQHATQAKSLTEKIEALGLTSLQQKLDAAIASNAAAAKTNDRLSKTRNDLKTKIDTEGASHSKASSARQRVEAELAKAKTELANTTTTKSNAVAASTRLERKLVDLKNEIGKVKKDIIFVDYQTGLVKDETDTVKEEIKTVLVEKKELIVKKDQLEEETEEISSEIKEQQKLAEEQAQKLKQKHENLLSASRKENNQEIEKLNIARENSNSNLENILADYNAKQIQLSIRGTVVDVYDQQVKKLKQELGSVQDDVKGMQRSESKLLRMNEHAQNSVEEAKKQSKEDDKLLRNMEKESKEVGRSKVEKSVKRDVLEDTLHLKQLEALKADTDANIMASSLQTALRDERSLNHLLLREKERDDVAEEERKRGVMLEAKNHANMMKANKEKHDLEKQIRQLNSTIIGPNQASHEVATSLQKEVGKLKEDSKLLEKDERSASKKLQQILADKEEAKKDNKKLEKENNQAAESFAEKKKAVEIEAKAAKQR